MCTPAGDRKAFYIELLSINCPYPPVVEEFWGIEAEGAGYGVRGKGQHASAPIQGSLGLYARLGAQTKCQAKNASQKVWDKWGTVSVVPQENKEYMERVMFKIATRRVPSRYNPETETVFLSIVSSLCAPNPKP